METIEKIVEAYVRYVKRWATISNIKCDGGYRSRWSRAVPHREWSVRLWLV